MLLGHLTAPCTVGKVISGTNAKLRADTLMKLEKVSRSLGSDKETVWMRRPEPLMSNYEEFRLSHLNLRRGLYRSLDGNLDGDWDESVENGTNETGPGRPLLMPMYSCLGKHLAVMTSPSRSDCPQVVHLQP